MWTPIVLIRIDQSTFEEYEVDGITTTGRTVVDGSDAEGLPLDDSLESEWGMTFMAIEAQQEQSQTVAVPKPVRLMLNNVFAKFSAQGIDREPTKVDHPKSSKPDSTGTDSASSNAATPPDPFSGDEKEDKEPADVQILTGEPKVGQRVLMDCEHSGIVWTVLAGMVGVLYDQPDKEWDSFDAAEFAVRAKPLTLEPANSAGDFQEVLIDKTFIGGAAGGPKTRKPAAALSGRIIKDAASGWDAFTQYTSMPDLPCYAVPPIPHKLKSGVAVQCDPPFLVASNGTDRFTAPQLLLPTAVWFIAILIGSESWTSTAKEASKLQRRRFALVRHGDTDYLVPLEAVQCILPSSLSKLSPPDEAAPSFHTCIEACKTAADARRAGAVHSAINRIKAETSNLKAAPNAKPETPRKRKAALKNHINEPDENDEDGGRAGKKGKTRSGIPLKMHGWALKRLEKCTRDQLLQALDENDLSPAGSAESNVSGYAKQRLLRKYELHCRTSCK
eukprot:6201743-Pleurochrysis_carterae.AAC.2